MGMMSIRNSGRFRRHARKAVATVALDENVDSDLTPTEGAWELRRTMTIAAPAANEYIILHKVGGAIAFTGILSGGDNRSITAKLARKIIDHDANQIQIHSKEDNGTVGGQTFCLDNQYASTLGIPSPRLSPLGGGFTVEFHTRFDKDPLSTVNEICMKDTRLEYDTIRVVRRG